MTLRLPRLLGNAALVGLILMAVPAEAKTHRVECGRIINPHTGEDTSSTVRNWHRDDKIQVPGKPKGKRYWSVRLEGNRNATIYFMSSGCGGQITFFRLRNYRSRPTVDNLRLK